MVCGGEKTKKGIMTMKKLMIAAVAGMFAVAANAAAMNWSTGMDYTDPAGIT